MFRTVEQETPISTVDVVLASTTLSCFIGGKVVSLLRRRDEHSRDSQVSRLQAIGSRIARFEEKVTHLTLKPQLNLLGLVQHLPEANTIGRDFEEFSNLERGTERLNTQIRGGRILEIGYMIGGIVSLGVLAFRHREQIMDGLEWLLDKLPEANPHEG